ncbi:hypothetical protein H650_00310 (plasmid) [Enterobacter sp. R4-368]|nr:hypothetical protein H650_00310 [Enterobacter sp. R4-368]
MRATLKATPAAWCSVGSDQQCTITVKAPAAPAQ